MNDRYIGDGVYASFDGFQIWLAVNHHSNKVVALEPEVIYNLLSYLKETEPDYFSIMLTNLKGSTQ